VKEIFESWADNGGRITSPDPTRDKNHKKTNKFAIKARATTAKAQGSFRRTSFAQNEIRFTHEELMKYKAASTYKPRGDEVYGKAKPYQDPVKEMVVNKWGNVAKIKQENKYQNIIDKLEKENKQKEEDKKYRFERG
jgi:hypothetical protein